MGMTPLPAIVANPHYERLGGADAVLRLVDAFYRAMDERADARTIRAMHAADLAETKRVLVAYLCEWLGGPKHYSAERGAPRLGRVHRPFALDAAARDAWLACMAQALAQVGAEASLQGELMRAFTKVATHLADPGPTIHTRSHP